METTATYKKYWAVLEEETGYLVMMIPFTARSKTREDCEKFLALIPGDYIIQEYNQKLEDLRIVYGKETDICKTC